MADVIITTSLTLTLPLLVMGVSASVAMSSTTIGVGDGFCAFDNIFGAGAPPYYVVHKVDDDAIVIDGSLNDKAWEDVPFTDSNPDICGTPGSDGNCGISGRGCKTNACATPRFRTRQKIRYSDTHLFVAAELEEPQVWANNTQHQSVIFSDNDYEIFISPDGSNHMYKEYEMNANGVWWDLCLNVPYTDGGYENSTRVMRPGWDDPGLKTATKVSGCTVNKPGAHACTGWTLEVAFPLAAVALNNTNVSLPPKPGQYWRINFSRVEWKVRVDNDHYVLKGNCSWPCPGGSPQNPGDNWLWAPLGVVDVHQPERWGYLQFADDDVNATAVVKDKDFAVRSVAMQLYYAMIGYMAGVGKGRYTTDVTMLASFAPLGVAALNGTCTYGIPTVILSSDCQFHCDNDGGGYVGRVYSFANNRMATITQDRHLLVVDI